MSVTNHTDIAVGADGNAATINSPLGQLDSAIGDRSSLKTAATSSLVAAVNELANPHQANYSAGTSTIPLQTTINQCDATAGTVNLNLPNVSDAAGRTYVIEKTDSSSNVVVAVGTVEGVTNPQLHGLYDKLVLFSDGTNWHCLHRDMTGTNTWDPASLADGAVAALTVAVAGATTGMQALASFPPINAAGWFISATVISPGLVAVQIMNKTGAPVDLGSGTVTVRVFAS